LKPEIRLLRIKMSMMQSPLEKNIKR